MCNDYIFLLCAYWLMATKIFILIPIACIMVFHTNCLYNGFSHKLLVCDGFSYKLFVCNGFSYILFLLKLFLV